jgi:L-lactate dehydrogenase complex protein LldG
MSAKQMADVRQRILDEIRTALRRQGPLDQARAAALNYEMSQKSQIESQIAARAGEQLNRHSQDTADIDLFLARLHESGADVTTVVMLENVPAAVEAICNEWQLATDFVASGEGLLSHINWPSTFTLHYRVAGRDDQLALTGVVCAIAETGSLVMRSGLHTPSSLNFLPENHIVVMQSSQIKARLEDAWAHVYDDAGRVPRAVNLITGPSKTADVEQTLQHGAHGPRRLHVVLVSQVARSDLASEIC